MLRHCKLKPVISSRPTRFSDDCERAFRPMRFRAKKSSTAFLMLSVGARIQAEQPIAVLQLVGGSFALESRFIIESSDDVVRMLSLIDDCEQKLRVRFFDLTFRKKCCCFCHSNACRRLFASETKIYDADFQAELWSVFVAIVRKSFRNLEACSRIGLITMCLERLAHEDAICADLLVELLALLANYSITVSSRIAAGSQPDRSPIAARSRAFIDSRSTNCVQKQFRTYAAGARDEAISACAASARRHLGTFFVCCCKVCISSRQLQRKNSSKLLSVMLEMPRRDGADVFFAFPGRAGAGLVLPPLARWPYQNGWSFACWFRMDPLNSVQFEKEKPILFQ